MRFAATPLLLVVLVLCSVLLFYNCRTGTGTADYIHDYYPLIYRGDLAFFKEDYTRSYQYLKEAIALKRPPNFEPYRELEKLANVCAMLNKPEEAIAYIERLVERGYELSVFQQDTTYAQVWQHPHWKALQAAYPEKREAYRKTVNWALRKEIAAMNARDQQYRSRVDRHQYREEQFRLDSINIARLQEIFELYGYPNADIIGYVPPDSSAQLDVLNIMMRTPGDLREQYFVPKLKSFIATGTCPPQHLGLLVDQYYLSREGYQVYGTMTGPKGLFKINEPKRLDERRLEVGMPTLHMEFQRDSLIRLSFYLDNLMN